jgi:transposase-like protein
MNPVSPRSDHHPPPSKLMCPVCRSDQVATTSKSVSETTYWRCQKCGEIWNPSRRDSFKPRW